MLERTLGSADRGACPAATHRAAWSVACFLHWSTWGAEHTLIVLQFLCSLCYFDIDSKMLLKGLDLSRVSLGTHLKLNLLLFFSSSFSPSQMVDHNRHECVFHGSCFIKYFIPWLLYICCFSCLGRWRAEFCLTQKVLSSLMAPSAPFHQK